MRERKLAAWQGAEVIDADTAARIRAFEAEHTRPLALWAVIGIGILAIGLGLVSVVAANWDAVPGTARLALHFALMAGLAALLWWRGDRLAAERPWAGEALLFILAVLGLTFFGHLGQVYQMSSPLWQPLGFWLVLFAPLILLTGRSWLTAALMMAVLVYACFDFAVAGEGLLTGSSTAEPDVMRVGLALSLPLLAAPLGAWMRGRGRVLADDRTDFWRRLEQLGFAYALLTGSLALILASTGDTVSDGDGARLMQVQAVQAVIGLLAAALVAWIRPGASGRASALGIAAASLAQIASGVVSAGELAAGLAFILLWCAVAAAAQMVGWRGVFQIAVGVVALRLVVLSFELASDLLLSGAGLIVAGLLILGIAWVALRISRRYAPPAESAVA
jgi:uncharacterized membrane protein